MNVSTTRHGRRDDLERRAGNAHARADALAALAALVTETPCPVARFAPTWHAVAQRLLADAATERRAAHHYRARLGDLDDAERAREAWIPRRVDT